MKCLLLPLVLPAIALLIAAVPAKPFRDAAYAPQMAVIPAGTAALGSTEAETTREGRTPAFAAFEHPQHSATFAGPYAVGVAHVSVREFAVFVRATHRMMSGCVVVLNGRWSDGPLAEYNYQNPGFRQRADEPAVCVSWDDATAYAAWLSARTRAHYRLLSEDEWEYAARGGTATARWWGDGAADICTRANGGDQDFAATMPDDKSANLSCSDGFARTNPSGHFSANPFGLHDMLGNAWQWTADCFVAVPGTTLPEPCAARSIRGGSWHNSVSTLRSATRFSLPPSMRSSSLGFRVMRELP